ncbi:uncharacterized protein EV154DRAFT_517907 [Mucor mucedo]|uniref:uncharacterized protein n=1 Tax=Mucor mucedo TaxID=29922 RepID=UPI00221F8150|nr:uncharacterized protein EV154DRAFT_517907 [Mucor mucedo]KAI7888435.1 hypothetical protein EV154DRAFT_517907 [Mucor mucedo]
MSSSKEEQNITTGTASEKDSLNDKEVNPTENLQVELETTAVEQQTIPAVNVEQDYSKLPEHVRILKEAFPDIDVEVIEAILQTQNDKLEPSFEILLGMSDPNYNSTPIPPQTQEITPTMPPRPSSQLSDNPRSRTNSGHAPYAYWEQQSQQAPITVEDQLRMDEEFAKKLAMEDELRANNRRQQHSQQQQQQQQQQYQKREQDMDQDSLFNLQEELPIIKEKMIEAGNAAKKKVMDFYNQLKANTRNNNMPNQHESASTSSIPTTHAQYRGLPSDDGDDLLTGDISALHLSDYDVYAQTGGRQKNKETIVAGSPPTSTPEAQLKADEDFARQLANESSTPPVKKGVTPTVVIAPRSPLEFDGDSDYEGIGLTTAPSTLNKPEENNTVPYVIGDDDDSDSDDLVDIDEDELFGVQDEKKSKEGPLLESTAKTSTPKSPESPADTVTKQ